MKSRYIFDKINQDLTAALARDVEQNPPRAGAATRDDIICALIFIVTITLLILL
jgi:hypothetical protein